MLKYFVPAVAVSVMAMSSPAAALTAASPDTLLKAGAGHAQEIQYRHSRRESREEDREYRHWRSDSHRYRPGATLRVAPPGYRRYAYRPDFWERQYCVQVGAFWFCP